MAVNKELLIKKIVSNVEGDIDVSEYAFEVEKLLNKAFKEVTFKSGNSLSEKSANAMDLITVFYESTDDFVGGSSVDYISSHAIDGLESSNVNISTISTKMKERLAKNIKSYALNPNRELARLKNL